MWLLHTERIQLQSFTGPITVPYAILSHVWRSDGEQSFQDLKALQAEARKKHSGLKGQLRKLRPGSTSKAASANGSILSLASDKIRGCCALADLGVFIVRAGARAGVV